jgi:hypothetical protein
MGPCAGVDYNIPLRLQSRLYHIYHEQPYARVDFIPQSGTDFASADMRGGGVGGGAKSYDLQKAWSSINHLNTL